jgi:hypothetical protein
VLLDLFNRLPAFKSHKDPALALILGLVFGGIGLGIYLRSWLDAIFPLIVVILLSVKFPSGGILYGAAIAGVWGCLRVVSSNRQLEAQAHGAA